MTTDKPRKGYSTGMAVFETYGPEVPTVDKPFGRALVETARRRPDIVGLTADLAKYTDLDLFAEAFPDRYFNLGMAEQNLIGVAAGLARVGFVPFATTYCSFAGRRAFDFIAIAVAEGRANVKIVCALPGLTTSYGATHQGVDDLALMRAVPNLVVIDPCDAVEIQAAVPAIADHPGPVYLRILRGRVKKVFGEDYRFEIGKARQLRDGTDVALLSTGLMTDRALQAAVLLERDGIGAAVLHFSTVKPLDEASVVQAAGETRAIVTLENHSVVGGFGSAVLETVGRAGLGISCARIGIPDAYLDCGSVPYLTEKHGLGVRHIVEAAKKAVEGKKRTPERKRG